MLNSTRIIYCLIFLACWHVCAHGADWLDFAHPQNPHPGANGPIVIDALFNDLNTTVMLPVLVVLMEFPDRAHRPDHTPGFWQDLVFGSPRNHSFRNSVSEVYREISNSRLLLVPATAGDSHDGSADGVVGWVDAAYNTTDPFWDPDGAEKARADAIRAADPLFDYYRYDNNGDGIISIDELVVFVVFADDACCDEHELGHSDPSNCQACPVGRCRGTLPASVSVDADTGYQTSVVQGTMAGVIEGAGEHGVCHELSHQILGHTDLYQMSCSNYQQVGDGYECNGIWYPPDPGAYSLMNYTFDSRPPNSFFVQHLDPWAKVHLGFVKPLVVNSDGIYVLYDIQAERDIADQQTQPEALIIYDPLKTSPYHEYFLLENRKLTGLDTNQEAEGLAVWLINEKDDYQVWPNYSDLRWVVRMNMRAGHWVSDYDALWDGSDDTQGYDLTAISTPRDTNWTDGSPSYIEIYDISPAGPTVSFKVRMPPIFVDANSPPSGETGSLLHPFDHLEEAISAIPQAPRTIYIAGGAYPEHLTISTPCTLKGWRNGDAIIGSY